MTFPKRYGARAKDAEEMMRNTRPRPIRGYSCKRERVSTSTYPAKLGEKQGQQLVCKKCGLLNNCGE